MFLKEAALFPDQVEQDKKIFNAWKKEREETGRSSVPVTIPVHVIIVHNPNQNVGQGDNISLDRINSQIQVLNDDFARTNADAGNTPGAFDAAGSDISFCLSTIDPDGNPTTGVTRYPTTADFQSTESTIISATIWPPTKYLNIYLAPDLDGLLGYAALPTPGNLPPTNNDVVRVLTSSFGAEGFATEPNYDEGRTATHEIGHWLGLRHVWGNAGGCNDDDGFDDTPPQSAPNYGCPNHPSSTCNNGGDMFMNYMDYVNDNCMNSFTSDQVAFMEMIIEGTRTGLINSASTACAPSGAPIVNLVNKIDIICSGDLGSIELTASSGTAPYTYSLNGGVAQASGVFTNLPGGDHVIIVTESEGITTQYNFTINEPPAVEFDIQILNEPCAGMNTGAVNIIPSGGNTPFNSISITGNNYNNTQSFYFVETFESGLPTDWTIDGEWQVGTSGEVSSAYFTIPPSDNILIFNDDALGNTHEGTGTVTSPNIDLGGGTDFNIIFDALYRGDNFGAQENATFYASEDNGATWIEVAVLQGINAWITYTFEVTSYQAPSIRLRFVYDDGGGWNTGLAIDNISVAPVSLGSVNDLAAGVYNVIAVDDADCQYTSSFEIIESDPITISTVDIVNPSCAGLGMVSVVAASANGIDRYELAGITDENGQFSLGAGDYTLVVYDNAGCSKSTTVTLSDQGGIGISLLSQANVSCPNGSDGEFILNFDNIQGDADFTINGVATVEKPYDMLAAGTYEVNVIDETGCSASFTVVITEPDPINITADLVAESCSSLGSINFTTTGGTPPYSYDGLATDMIPDLAAGVYPITCVDANGCSQTASFTIEAESSNIEITESFLICGRADDRVDYLIEMCTSDGSQANWLLYDEQGVQISNPGMGPCIELDMSSFLENSDSDFSYTIEAVADNGCVTALNATAIQPAYIYTETIDDLILCPDDVWTFVPFNIDDFTSFTMTDIDGNTVDQDVEGNFLLSPASNYKILATDMRGCLIETEVTIEEGSIPEIEVVSTTDATSTTGGSVELNGSGGAGEYIFTLNGEQNTTGVFTGLDPDFYSVLIFDANGCVNEITFEIKLESSINNLILSTKIELYPNPTSNQLFVKLDGEFLIDKLSIYSIDGKKVKLMQTSSQEVAIDAKELESGMYIIEIQSGSKVGYGKFLRE